MLFGLAILVGLLSSCKKNNPADPQQPPVGQVKRPHGPVVGEAAVAQLGAAGGSLTSKDGVLKITVPAGAIDGTTSFSIQEVENVLENGPKAYRLLPEEIEFKKPITLVYDYSSFDLGAANPNMLFLTYQDKDGYFFTANKTRGNRQQQTLTLTTTHFSDWTFFAEYELRFPDGNTLTNGELRVPQGGNARIVLLSRKFDRKEDHSELPEVIADPVIHAAAWEHSPKIGTIARLDDLPGILYTAPNKVETAQRTFINATINGRLGVDNLGNIVQQIQFRQPVVVVGDEYFTITENGMESDATNYSALYIPGFGTQIGASFLGGYTINIMTYGTATGGYEYGEHGIDGNASVGLSELDRQGFVSFRPDRCDGQDSDAYYSPGEVTFTSLAKNKGEYFEGYFTVTLWLTDYCKKNTSKKLSGKFRIRKHD